MHRIPTVSRHLQIKQNQEILLVVHLMVATSVSDVRRELSVFVRRNLCEEVVYRNTVRNIVARTEEAATTENTNERRLLFTP